MSKIENQKWEEEKNDIESENTVREKKRQEMIIRKRKYERKELNKRLEDARTKYVEAQRCLENLLEKKDKKTRIFLNDIGLSKELVRIKKKMEDDGKKKLIQQAFKEVQKGEEECKKQHDQVKREKLECAKRKKEEWESIEKKKIIKYNR